MPLQKPELLHEIRDILDGYFYCRTLTTGGKSLNTIDYEQLTS